MRLPSPPHRIVSASTVSRLTCATKSVCTIAAACAGSFSARAWSPRMPNASTAVPIGPCSATIDVDERRVRGQVVGVELAHVHGAWRPAARTRRDLRRRARSAPPRRRAPPSRPGASRVASSSPISLRPPKITIDARAVRVLHGCDYVLRYVVRLDGEGNHRLTNDALAFLTERHLAMLTTLRSDNSPHVVAVGFTFDPKTHIARVITTGGSQKAVNAESAGVAVLSQVDGARWLSLEGKSVGQHRHRGGARRRTALRPALPHTAGQPASAW